MENETTTELIKDNCLNCDKQIFSIPKRKKKKFCCAKCCFIFWKRHNLKHYGELIKGKSKDYKKLNCLKWKEQGLCSRCGRKRDNTLNKWCEGCKAYFRQLWKNKKAVVTIK